MACCFQKNPSKGRVCYAPIGTRATTAGTNDAGTFGVSIGQKTDAVNMESGQFDSQCTNDYLAFSTGAHFVASAAIAAKSNSPAKTDLFKICGRAFNSATIAKAPAQSACVSKEPFSIRVVFDDEELYSGTTKKPATNEYQGSAPGTIGFALHYSRMA
jgi:hypothetical protein